MSIAIKWYSQDKMQIYTRFEDPWSLEEFTEARKKWYRMIKSVDYWVPIILDLSKTYDLPDGILREFIAIHRTPHPRQSNIVVFGLNPLYQRLSRFLFSNVGIVDHKKQVKIVLSLDEALIASQNHHVISN